MRLYRPFEYHALVRDTYDNPRKARPPLDGLNARTVNAYVEWLRRQGVAYVVRVDVEGMFYVKSDLAR